MDELATLSPWAADAAARAAREAAGAAAGARADVDAALGGLGGWWGAARDGFDGRVRDLLADVDLLTRAAAAGATAIEEHSAELGMLAGRLRTVDAAIADAERRTRDPGATAAGFHTAWAELERWHTTRAQVLAAHDDSSERLARRLLALVADVADRPRTAGEHVADAARALVAEGAAAAYAVAGWAWDADGWAEDLLAAPGQVLDDLRHPGEAAAEALHLDDARAGRWGALAGGLGAGLAGRGLGRAVEGAPGRPGGDRPRGRDEDPLPQTLDEMLAGVDLARSEGRGRGHTLERHVDVDDAYLQDRLVNGTRFGGKRGGRGAPPPAASRWVDLETAERTITAALRENEARVRRALAAGEDVELRVPVDASAGTVLVRDSTGFRRVPAEQAVVRLRRDERGTPFIVTSFLDREKHP
ncbi:RNase A-like domain-containing protein [Kineococcus gypseus]|uniref:RNase A-like domain-containing protein n=1 Tax=Kineococcus gypseus TaxID=1637102 RepID=UPI003D7EFD64